MCSASQALRDLHPLDPAISEIDYTPWTDFWLFSKINNISLFLETLLATSFTNALQDIRIKSC